MPLSRRDRFKLRSQLSDVLGTEWSFDKTNLLLIEFGLPTMADDSWHGPSIVDVVAGISDADLIEMYALVMGVETDEVEGVIESTDESGSWKTGYARIFLSHSAAHKEFAGKVADELAVVGIHGFVAHDAMEYSKPWQMQIEKALRSMEAFVALVHPEFNSSTWCQEEVGWALGRRVPLFVVRLGVDPEGFIGRDQWPSCAGKGPGEVAKVISAWASTVPDLGATVVEGLFSALRGAGNYVDAGATAERLAALGSLSDEQFELLDEIWWSNDQLHGGVLPTRAMKPFYDAHGRPWPPPKPAPTSDDEEPF